MTALPIMNVLALNPVLVIDLDLDDLIVLHTLLRMLHNPNIVTCSSSQALMFAQRISPALIIVAGHHRRWSKARLHQLRRSTGQSQVTVVALADHQYPSWMPNDENPGLDGFLVKPLSLDVLTSLVETAWAKQVCHAIG